MTNCHLLEGLVRRTDLLCRQAMVDRESLEISADSIGGATRIDFAPQQRGTLASGIRLAEICLGGYADGLANR